MEWKSNARMNQDPEAGTIFKLKNNPLDVCIHKYVRCGGNWYLSCDKLGIDTQFLGTEDFNEAVEKAKQIIETYSRRIFLDAQSFFESTEENIMVKY